MNHDTDAISDATLETLTADPRPAPYLGQPGITACAPGERHSMRKSTFESKEAVTCRWCGLTRLVGVGKTATS